MAAEGLSRNPDRAQLNRLFPAPRRGSSLRRVGRVSETGSTPLVTMHELHRSVRAACPPNVTTCVELEVWHHASLRPQENISVRIWVSELNDAVRAPTADRALELFRNKLLPRLLQQDAERLELREELATEV